MSSVEMRQERKKKKLNTGVDKNYRGQCGSFWRDIPKNRCL